MKELITPSSEDSDQKSLKNSLKIECFWGSERYIQ
jgi:hypothetical protein